MNKHLSRISMTLVAFLLGLLLMAQFATQQRMDSKRASASSADGALLISNLVEGNSRLRQEVDELNRQLEGYRGASNQARLQAMTEETQRLQVLNGVVEVSGPGIQVTLDGPVTALDLQDLLNELRNAGAEAFALNGQRIVAQSVVAPTADGGMSVDGIRVRRPYIFTAIGDPATLETALLRPGGLLAVFGNSREGLRVDVQRQSHIIIPAHAQLRTFQYAVPVRQ